MRAPTIFLGLFRIGAYLLPPASSFQTHHHHPSAAAAASVLRDGGAIITGTKSKGASAPSNRDDEEVDHPDDDGRAAALAGGTTTSRRSFAEDAMARASIFLGSSLLVACQQPTSPAHASGGATAGGAYLLSAKQRYNKRVLAGIKSFLTLDARDLGEVNAYFASSEEGGWEDLSAAGYLLSNAFRTSSTKAPDALPSVKKWKAFAREIELLKLASSKKNAEKVLSAYASASEKLDDYLAAVELPSGMELKQM